MVLLQNFFKQFTAETKQKLVICISCSLPASWQVATRQTIFILHECFAHLIIIVFHIMSTSLNWIPSRSDIRCISNLWWWSQCAYVNVFESEFLSYLTVRAQCRENVPYWLKDGSRGSCRTDPAKDGELPMPVQCHKMGHWTAKWSHYDE